MSQLIQIYAQFDTVSLQKPVHRYTGSESCRVLSDFSANDICHPDGRRVRAAGYGCFNSGPPTQRPRLATERVASASITVVSRPFDVFVPCSYTCQNMCKQYGHCHWWTTAGRLSLSTVKSIEGQRNEIRRKSKQRVRSFAVFLLHLLLHFENNFMYLSIKDTT
jgi:hypothetical protein